MAATENLSPKLRSKRLREDGSRARHFVEMSRKRLPIAGSVIGKRMSILFC